MKIFEVANNDIRAVVAKIKQAIAVYGQNSQTSSPTTAPANTSISYKGHTAKKEGNSFTIYRDSDNKKIGTARDEAYARRIIDLATK